MGSILSILKGDYKYMFDLGKYTILNVTISYKQFLIMEKVSSALAFKNTLQKNYFCINFLNSHNLDSGKQ